jgi:molybdopterin molybdotransferase
MIPVSQAREIICKKLTETASETVDLLAAHGRTLAMPVRADLSRPPLPVSAMDGFAFRRADVTTFPARLRVTTVASAGDPPAPAVPAGEAARILTGAAMPADTDVVVLQEEVEYDGNVILVRQLPAIGCYIRGRGDDFCAGDALLAPGVRLSARHLGLLAAANVNRVGVRRRPRVCFFANGDEVVRPGERSVGAQIIDSNTTYFTAELHAMGAEPVNLGLVPDDPAAIARAVASAGGHDLLVTLGGASVGDRDFVRPTLQSLGLRPEFDRVAMRPGKPASFGWLRELPVLMLPGNAVSAAVTTLIFVWPAVATMLGSRQRRPQCVAATLTEALPENNDREDYLRATLTTDDEGLFSVSPFSRQDSAQLRLFARADCLIVRAPFAPPADRGDRVKVLLLSSD